MDIMNLTGGPDFPFLAYQHFMLCIFIPKIWWAFFYRGWWPGHSDFELGGHSRAVQPRVSDDVAEQWRSQRQQHFLHWLEWLPNASETLPTKATATSKLLSNAISSKILYFIQITELDLSSLSSYRSSFYLSSVEFQGVVNELFHDKLNSWKTMHCFSFFTVYC